MKNAVQKVLLRSVPAAPAVNKWGKFAEPLDFTLALMLLHQILPLGLLAIRGPKDMANTDGLQGDFTELDSQLWQDLNFSAVLGSRFKMTCDFATKPDNVALLLSVALVIEPLRYLTVLCLAVLQPCFRNPQFALWQPGVLNQRCKPAL
jgi:hypothetical protein